MTTIYKYVLQLKDEQTIEMPYGSETLSVQVQNGDLCIWALVDTDVIEKEIHKFHINGTGNPASGTMFGSFVGTVQMNPFVWHIFETLE